VPRTNELFRQCPTESAGDAGDDDFHWDVCSLTASHNSLRW
jgi:hypothetical protein